MPANRKHIVCFGREKVLLLTRRLLLNQAGYVVHTTSDANVVAKWLLCDDVGVVILCHTVPKREADTIFKFHQERHSTAQLLCLSVGDRLSEVDCARVYNAQKGPAAFLAEVGALNMYQTAMSSMGSWVPLAM